MSIKNQAAMLAKLGISELNSMQLETHAAIRSQDEVILLSPTGSGKTMAFLIPLIERLQADLNEVQALILVPTRELAIQIEQVTRNLGSGFKTNAIYGGRAGSKDKTDLQHRPAILIGTPGRIADHLRRETFPAIHISSLVLDEFDKSLEIGFEHEMEEILDALTHLKKKVLTSATHDVEIPDFVRLMEPKTINYLSEEASPLIIKKVTSPVNDKLETLLHTLRHLGDQPGIVFCNFKDSIARVSDYLTDEGIDHGCFYGGMEQQDRERVLIKFRNGTHRLLIATDLAARGIDIPEIRFIIHYHLPVKATEFTHRNGRTARMNQDGIALVLQGAHEALPDFIGELDEASFENQSLPTSPAWKTLFVSGGRKDKISKGDIAGLFFRKGDLKNPELGTIELKQDCAFVAVKAEKAEKIVNLLNNERIKKRKLRIHLI